MTGYGFIIHWLTMSPSPEGRIIEEGDFPVHVLSDDSDDALFQAMKIADRMSNVFDDGVTFFYKIG